MTSDAILTRFDDLNTRRQGDWRAPDKATQRAVVRRNPGLLASVRQTAVDPTDARNDETETPLHRERSLGRRDLPVEPVERPARLPVQPGLGCPSGQPFQYPPRRRSARVLQGSDDARLTHPGRPILAQPVQEPGGTSAVLGPGVPASAIRSCGSATSAIASSHWVARDLVSNSAGNRHRVPPLAQPGRRLLWRGRQRQHGLVRPRRVRGGRYSLSPASARSDSARRADSAPHLAERQRVG